MLCFDILFLVVFVLNISSTPSVTVIIHCGHVCIVWASCVSSGAWSRWPQRYGLNRAHCWAIAGRKKTGSILRCRISVNTTEFRCSQRKTELRNATLVSDAGRAAVWCLVTAALSADSGSCNNKAEREWCSNSFCVSGQKKTLTVLSVGYKGQLVCVCVH